MFSNILMIFSSILCTFIICSIIYTYTGGRLFYQLYHDILGWHIPYKDDNHFEGINICSQCKICNKEIMMDSQGNWFEK